MHPLAQDLDLGAPQRGLEGGQLTVDIGFGHVVQIDQREPADRTAGQRLDRPGPNATHSDDHDMRGADALVAPLPVETPDTCETPLCHLPRTRLQKKPMIHFGPIARTPGTHIMSRLPIDPELPQTEDFERIFLDEVPLMDVRAPVEFADGAFPLASNIPLIDDLERHHIGTTYKDRGQDAAIAEGLRRVSGELKQRRIAAWEAFARKHPQGILYCFRGGMRSQIAQQWLHDATGITYPRIRGGYKALRRYLIEQLEQNAEKMRPVVIGGRTGVGKTRLIQELSPRLDLEDLAWHRGSAFGRHATPQPAQISFENALSIQLLRIVKRGNPYFVAEDESRNIGARHVPMAFFEPFSEAPVVVLEADLEERIAVTREEYVHDALAEYVALAGPDTGWEQWADYLRDSLGRIRKRLGGVDYKRISGLLESALRHHRESGDTDVHDAWIEALLSDYYDAMYRYQLEQKQNRIRFTGNKDQVRAFLNDEFGIGPA